MGLLERIRIFFRREEKERETAEEERSFFLYIKRIPEILTYFRREKGISRRNLELALLDNEEEPPWKIRRIVKLLIPELRMLYLLTRRPEDFAELADEVLEEYGLMVLLLSVPEAQSFPGNLFLDLNGWENQLDIINRVSYHNTMTR